MRTLAFCNGKAVGAAILAATVSLGALLPSPAHAFDRGWGGRGWGWGVGVGLGLDAAIIASSWPGYYYPYAYAPTVVVQQPQVVASVAAPAAPATYYYCASPQGYYPYVNSCKVAWQPVPASPPPAAQPAR